MAVLKEQVASRTKGVMGETEDWWHLCYDTETQEFFIEHTWHHVRLNNFATTEGSKRETLDAWKSEDIDNAKAALLRRASEQNGA